MRLTGRHWSLIAALCLQACSGGRAEYGAVRIPGADARHGKETIRSVGCGACHSIPGIRSADGVVGPPLENFAHRSFIAGALPNTPVNLMRWVAAAHSVEPATAMPNLGLDEQQARDVTAYLYTLR